MRSLRCAGGVVAAVLISMAGLAVADAWDPGDDLSTGAIVLTPTSTPQTHGAHTMAGLDCEDWFRISMTAGVTYHFDTVGGTGDNAAILYDSTATSFMDFDDSSGGGSQFSLDFTPTTSGLYYLDVLNWGCGSVGANWTLNYWTITISGGDAWDPGDNLNSGATDIIPTGTMQTHGVHTMSTTDCDDWFSISMTAGTTYHFDTVGGTGDNFAYLFNSGLTFQSYDDQSGGGNQFSMDFTPSTSGLYYLDVSNWGCGSGGNWSGNLRFWTTTATGGDAWDPGDNTGSGGTMLTPTPAIQSHGPHTISAADCYDWYRIAMTAGTAYHFDTVGGTGDNYGYLYSDAAGTLLVASNDDSGGLLQFSFTYTPTASATYYLRVMPFGGCTGSWSGAVRYWTNSLRTAVAMAPASMSIGQTFQVRMTVTNSGASSVSGVIPALQVNAGSGLVSLLSGPAPSGPVTLASGAAQTFVWTYSATAAGSVSMTVTAAGTGGIRGAATGLVVISAAGALDSALAITPALAPSGSNITLVMSVTNTGGNAINNLLAMVTPVSGTSLVVAVSGPSPAGPVTLATGAVQRFTWVYSTTGTGTANFAATAGGTDAVTFAVVGTGAVRSVTILQPAALSVQLSLTPPVTIPGQVVTVIASITNTGGATANTVNANISTGCCITGPISPPSPPPFLTIAAGATSRFTWSFTATGVGTSTFTTWISGTDATFGGGLAVSDSAPLTSKAALVSATLQITATITPVIAAVGAPVTVVATLTNAGDYSATGVLPALVLGTTVFTVLAGPVPAGPLTIPPLATASFTWTLSAVGSGSASAWVEATGTNAGPGGGVLYTGNLTPVFRAQFSLLNAWLTVRPMVRRGETVSLELSVSNSGSGSVSGLLPSLSAPGLIVVSGPVPTGGGTLATGATATFRWEGRFETDGSITLAGRADGTDGIGLMPVWAATTATLMVSAGFDEPLVVYPNPVKGDLLRIGVRARAPAKSFKAEIWNIARDRVYEGTWPVTAADAILEIRGVLGWAPGLYAVRVTAILADGSDEIFPFVPLAVRR